MPKVSVLMNCYNSDSFLREAIDSVYAQSYDDWEIVFWDNRSTDESAKIAQSYDARMKYFRGAEFLPLGEARNQALKQTRGEFVAILDCDDVWRPDKLAKQVALLEANPDVAVAYSNCDIIDRDGRVIGPLLSQSQYCRGTVFEPLLLFKFFPPWPTVVIRKSACQLETAFASYKILEDYDFLLKIAALHPFDYVADSLALYRTHAGQLFRDSELTLQEQLSVCEYWAGQAEFQTPAGQRLIRQSKAQAYLSAGTAALYKGGDKAKMRAHFIHSLRTAISVRPLFYLFISLIGQRRAREFATLIREKLGYSPNLHLKAD